MMTNDSRVYASAQTPGQPDYRLKFFALAMSAAMVAGFSMRAKAVGFRLPNQDPEGIARGNAFVATADNPSAIYYNPAGITQLEGQNVSVGLYLVSAGTEYKSFTGAKAKTDTDFQPVPQLYYTGSITNTPIYYGVGIYAPYGLGIDWGKNPPFRTLVEKGSLVYATVNPVIAWQVCPTLSLAAGPTINYSKADLKQGISPLSTTDQFRFKGDDVDYGFNLGLRWQPLEKWAFGVKYFSATELDYHGESQFHPYAPQTDTHAAIKFPQSVTAGVSFRPTENWNLEFNIDWTDWDTLNSIILKGTTPALTTGSVTNTLNYKSSFMYEFGVTRKLDTNWFVSAGYFFSESSSPSRHFTPLVPDSDLHLFSVGVGRKGQRWDWALGYTLAFSGDYKIKNNVSPAANGTYSAINHAINISTTFKF
jgi:long-chain fatty acid transport protein